MTLASCGRLGYSASQETDAASVLDSGACSFRAILASGPIAYFRLGEDNVAQPVRDLAGGGDGIYVSATVGESGVSADGDSAVRLGDVVDSHVLIEPTGTWPSIALSVEMWVQTSTANRGTPLSYATPIEVDGINLYNIDALSFEVHGESLSTGQNVADGGWHHLAATWQSDDGAAVVYVDAVPVLTGNIAIGVSIPAGGALVMGQEQDAVGGGFQANQALVGVMDEVAIFDRVLSGDEIAGHMAAAACQ